MTTDQAAHIIDTMPDTYTLSQALTHLQETNTREKITKHMAERIRNMREAQARYHAQPQRHTLKAKAAMHGEAFMAIYMLACDLYTPVEVAEIYQQAERKAAE